LNSSTIRQNFFDTHYLPAQEQNETEADKQRAWEQLDEQLTILLPREADEVEASLTLEGDDPKTIAAWANAYVDLSIRAANEELLSGLAGEVKIRQLSLENQLVTLRQTADKMRNDRITRLEEALATAESIGLDTPRELGSLIAINTYGLNTENIQSGSLLYL